MYTHWNIECQIKPEYIDLIKYFILNHQDWPDEVPDFITKWRTFLDDDYYIGLSGCNGFWGYRLELIDDILYLCGSCKNYNNELEYFLCKVLVRLGNIIQCKSISDYSLDYQPELNSDDHVYYYSDEQLRTTSWRKLIIW